MFTSFGFIFWRMKRNEMHEKKKKKIKEKRQDILYPLKHTTKSEKIKERISKCEFCKHTFFSAQIETNK